MLIVNGNENAIFVVIWKRIETPLCIGRKYCKEMLAGVVSLLPRLTRTLWCAQVHKVLFIRIGRAFDVKFAFLEIHLFENSPLKYQSIGILQQHNDILGNVLRIVVACLTNKQGHFDCTTDMHC